MRTFHVEQSANTHTSGHYCNVPTGIILGFLKKSGILDILRILETHEERHHLQYRVDLIWCLLREIAAAIC